MQSDIVIVGAGSAGAVVARRLSERSSLSVTLLEAGPDYADPARVPTDLTDGTRNSMTAHDWGYRHRPTHLPRLFPLPRGRVVGGSSAVNTCIALRGQPEDFDEWAARDMPEWSWSECLPAFKRLERDLDFADAFHGQTGPLPLRRHPPEEWVPFQTGFVQACLELGFAACPDSNAPGSEGVGPHAMNKLDGRRISVAEAFLDAEVRARDNLTLRPQVLVRRILFERRQVVGLELEGRDGIEVLKTRHIVLCAGAINTPGILLRSGVGPRAEVERLGCTLVADVPAVGRRLLDHPGTAIFLMPRHANTANPGDPLIQTVLRYPSGERAHTTDMLLQPGSKLALPHGNLPLVSIMCSVGKPRGTGVLRFDSPDPRARPRIDSRLLEDEGDRKLAVDAMLLSYELLHTHALRDLVMPLWPSERVLRARRRVDAWIRSSCDSGYHPCGTVPMGAADDPDAATSPHGRVRGVEGLHVADASLMPTIPSSNIHLPTLMVAERIGAWLRDGDA
jgi:choline dehydrogenase